MIIINPGFAHSVACKVLAVWLVISGSVYAGSAARQEIISNYASEVRTTNQGFEHFSSVRGEQLFSSYVGGGKPDTPSCTACHMKNPLDKGETRAGKEIAPMALSRSPDRYSDPGKVEKWFRRNCKSVLGRNCTALEKGDFITFMINQ
jgi:hypothetical protein